jgi:circadian clock protein KaiB
MAEMEGVSGEKWRVPGDLQEPVCLRLYVAGASANSVRAIKNIKSFCEEFMPNRYSLEIVDVHQQPLLAENEQIIALPLLVRVSPASARRLVGDMSDTTKIIRGLGLVLTD